MNINKYRSLYKEDDTAVIRKCLKKPVKMKGKIGVLFLMFVPGILFAQNLVKDTGSVGIGTLTPSAKLDVFDNGRHYYVDRKIPGSTAESTGTTYLLLHAISTGALVDERHVMGKITAIRGGVCCWNRKWTVEVNTSCAYNTTRGSIISYNEPARLVTLVYQGSTYIAAEIASTSSMKDISFTGYAAHESFMLAYSTEVSNVQVFNGFDPIAIQGKVVIGTLAATTTGNNALTVEGTIGARKIKVTQGTWADFVFHPDYRLPSLTGVERYIKSHRHLPEMPSAAQVEKEGIDLGEMNKKLLQKVEELTLYIIQQQKVIENQEKRLQRLECKN